MNKRVTYVLDERLVRNVQTISEMLNVSQSIIVETALCLLLVQDESTSLMCICDYMGADWAMEHFWSDAGILPDDSIFVEGVR